MGTRIKCIRLSCTGHRFGDTVALASPDCVLAGTGVFLMLRLIARRLVIGLLVALTVMTLAFLLTRLSGDLAVSTSACVADGPAISARAISSRTAWRT